MYLFHFSYLQCLRFPVLVFCLCSSSWNFLIFHFQNSVSLEFLSLFYFQFKVLNSFIFVVSRTSFSDLWISFLKTSIIFIKAVLKYFSCASSYFNIQGLLLYDTCDFLETCWLNFFSLCFYAGFLTPGFWMILGIGVHFWIFFYCWVSTLFLRFSFCYFLHPFSCCVHRECLLVLPVGILKWVAGRKVGEGLCDMLGWDERGKGDHSRLSVTEVRMRLRGLDLMSKRVVGLALAFLLPLENQSWC